MASWIGSRPSALTMILVLGPAAAAGPQSVWICSDPISENFGEKVDLAIVGHEAALVTRDASALVQADEG